MCSARVINPVTEPLSRHRFRWLGAALAGLAVSFGILGAASVQAQEVNCEAPANQTEIGLCIRQALRQAEADLDVAYGLAWSRMVRIDDALPASERGAEVSLRNAQQIWIRYREATCEFEGFEHAGEDIEPMIVSLCVERLTRSRIEDLRAVAQPD